MIFSMYGYWVTLKIEYGPWSKQVRGCAALINVRDVCWAYIFIDAVSLTRHLLSAKEFFSVVSRVSSSVSLLRIFVSMACYTVLAFDIGYAQRRSETVGRPRPGSDLAPFSDDGGGIFQNFAPLPKPHSGLSAPRCYAAGYILTECLNTPSLCEHILLFCISWNVTSLTFVSLLHCGCLKQRMMLCIVISFSKIFWKFIFHETFITEELTAGKMRPVERTGF